MRATRWLPRLSLILIAVVLPLIGHWARRGAQRRCALDGVRIEPVYRVQVVDGQGEAHDFCCIRCAELWVGRQKAGAREILVTDEVSGRPIDLDEAHFVRSRIVTVSTSGNRIHVFGNSADAEEHARAAAGTILRGLDRPFRAGAPESESR